MTIKDRMSKLWKTKSIRDQGIKITDSLKTLCSFMKNVSQEWDIEESKELTYWYIDQFYQRLQNETNETNETENNNLQEKHNQILIHTLSLWNDFHYLCPLIQDFNMYALEKVDDKTIGLVLPQLIMVSRNTRDTKLTDILIKRCKNSRSNSISLFWLLVVEIERDADCTRKAASKQPQVQSQYGLDRFFARFAYLFMSRMTVTPENKILKEILVKQGLLVEKLVALSGSIRQSRASIMEKKKMIKRRIYEAPDLLLFDPIPLPIKGNVDVIGIVPEECSVFQSQLNPMLLSFLTKDGQIFKCIFKSGDDLRQDAIMGQILKMTCKILKSNGVSPDDIVTYEIVSTGLSHGFVEFVPSECLDNIFQRQNGLRSVLLKRDESAGANSNSKHNKLDERKMEKFINSTAYYTVITYIMCIGDRHLDNILLKDDGSLFHIDYGFIAREPKPFAPAVKLCPEIIEIMGGKNSGYYVTFMKRCLSCYLILRKNAHVILDALELMLDAGINDINVNTICKIKQRFALEVSDKEAISTLTADIEKGFENVLPKMMDNFHHTWKVVSAGGMTTRKEEENLSTEIFLDIEEIHQEDIQDVQAEELQDIVDEWLLLDLEDHF